MEACHAALGRSDAGGRVPDGERCTDEELTKDLRAFPRKHSLCESQVSSREEWEMRTAEITSSVGDPRE